LDPPSTGAFERDGLVAAVAFENIEGGIVEFLFLDRKPGWIAVDLDRPRGERLDVFTFPLSALPPAPE